VASHTEISEPEIAEALGVAVPHTITEDSPPKILKVGFHERIPWPSHFALSVQNMLVMAGLFLFPGLLGAAYHFNAGGIARLYGAAFVVCGFGTVLQGMVGLKMPIVLGPWSASLAGLLVLGQIYGLGTATTALALSSAIIAVFCIPIGGRMSIMRRLAGIFSSPALTGGIVLINGLGLTQIAVVNWVGKPGGVGFGAGNWVGGAVAMFIAAGLFAFTRGFIRAAAMICGIIIGALVFWIFAPIHFTALEHGPVFAVPRVFHYGVHFNLAAVLIFLVLEFPPIINALGFYPVVAEWGDETVSETRMSWGAFGVAGSGVLAGMLGVFSGSVYPENVGLLRSSRVGSRWITITAGVLFIIVGFVYKVGAVFAGIPSAVIGAAAVVMFAVIMMAGIELLAKVDWSPRNILLVGLPCVLSLGGTFLSPEVYAGYPVVVREVITQPLVTGPFLLVILFLINRMIPARYGQRR
jgi:xanthine/uracil permease